MVAEQQTVHTEQDWDAETITEVVACYRESRALYKQLFAQKLRLDEDVRRAEAALMLSTRLYNRCLQETAVVPEQRRQLEALMAERDQVAS